jgi:hypothetical protein
VVGKNDEGGVVEFLALRKGAAKMRTAAEDTEKVGGDHAGHHHRHRSARFVQAEAASHESGDAVEGCALRAPIEEVG